MWTGASYKNRDVSEEISCSVCGKKAEYVRLPTNHVRLFCKSCKEADTSGYEFCPMESTCKTEITYITEHQRAVNINEITYQLETRKRRDAIYHLDCDNDANSTRVNRNIITGERVREDTIQEVTTTFSKFIHYAFDDARDFILSETDRLVILNVIRKYNKITTCFFLKSDGGKLTEYVVGKGESPYKTSAQRETERIAKRNKERSNNGEIIAVRGDGSVTTLNRLLNNEPDIAPPGTRPPLNI
jgi:hypothetical protein